MGVITNQPNPNPNIVQTTRRVVDPCIHKPNHEKWGCTFVVPAAASPKSRSRRRHSAPSSDVPAAACPRSVFQGDEQTTMMRKIPLSRRRRCRRRRWGPCRRSPASAGGHAHRSGTPSASGTPPATDDASRVDFRRPPPLLALFPSAARKYPPCLRATCTGAIQEPAMSGTFSGAARSPEK